MMIAIQGIGLVGGFGCGIQDFHHCLRQQKSTVRTVEIEGSGGKITVPALLADTAKIAAYAPKRSLRRLSHYTQMAYLGACLALEDAGAYQQIAASEGAGLGVILATGYGATCNAFDFKHSIVGGEPWGSPIKFSNSVHNAAAAHISILLKEYGPNLSLSHFDMSLPSAVLTACQWLVEDRVESVLVGGVDEFCNILGHYWAGVQELSVSGQPNQAAPCAVIGEGSVFFLLTKSPLSKYGHVVEVAMGRRRGGQDRFKGYTEDSLFILNADGYSGCDGDYAAALPPGVAAAVYTPLYGGLPIGMGFDIAVAGLTLQTGEYYASIGAVQWPHASFKPRPQFPGSAPENIICLKFGAAGDYGLVRLAGKPGAISFKGA